MKWNAFLSQALYIFDMFWHLEQGWSLSGMLLEQTTQGSVNNAVISQNRMNVVQANSEDYSKIDAECKWMSSDQPRSFEMNPYCLTQQHKNTI